MPRAMIPLTTVSPLQINNSFAIWITNCSRPGQLTSHDFCDSRHWDNIYLKLMLME